MASYVYEKDGKVHTRYSELKRCTPGGAEAVVLERLGLRTRFEGADMAFGTERHLMWEEESRESLLLPECFEYELAKHAIPKDTPLSIIEDELKIEVFPGVVLHLTPDSVSEEAGIVFDNKTIVGTADQFKSSVQLKIYAYALYKLGIRIKRGIFLCEIWSKDHKRILGYDSYVQTIGLTDIADAEKWLRDHAEVLVTAIEVIKDRTKSL